MTTIAFKIPRLTKAQFAEICQMNPDLRLELTAIGDVIIMPPTYSWTGKQNSGLTAQLWNWNDRTNQGIVFDSSTGFTLPNGAVRSPDASWVTHSQWDRLTEAQRREEFSPLAPTFVVELRSSSDSLEKMQEYLSNGVLLGWLLDSKTRQVEVYRSGQGVEILDSPAALLGEDILPGFVLDLGKIW